MMVLETILARLEPEHARALEWFVDHEGEVGPRPWRRDGKSSVRGISIPLTAERGIHKPKGMQWALSIAAAKKSVYLDGKPERVDQETWVLPYSEHAGADGAGYESRWNRALLKNMEDRIPVGVFVQASGSSYRNLGLAVPESFDPTAGAFLLRGPMRFSQSAATWGDMAPHEDEEVLAGMAGMTGMVVEENIEPQTLALVRRRKAQDSFRSALVTAYDGKCCVTQYDALDALQGAHILSYSGRSSQVVKNGLLLRADLHLLFDRHLIGIEPEDLEVRVSPRIMSTAYAELDGRTLQPAIDSTMAPDKGNLRVHWDVFSRAGL